MAIVKLYLTTWQRLAGALVAVALAACGGVGGSTPPSAATGVTALPGGAPVAFARQGQRGHAPTVVFQSGLGDDHAAWALVLQRLPETIEAISPDRPGYGASPQRPGVRDACRIAHEQRQLLRRSGAAPPYLLVGHSIGGLYQYVYARLFPEEVAGIVLLDPTHPDTLQAVEREQPGMAALLRLARHTVFTSAMRQEFDAQAECLAKVDRALPLPMPAIVMASTRLPVYIGAELQSTLDRLRDDWVVRTNANQLTPVYGSGHVIQRDAPDVVVQAILQLSARPAAPHLVP